MTLVPLHQDHYSFAIPAIVCVAAAYCIVSSEGASHSSTEADAESCCSCPSPISDLLSHYALTILRTVEVAVRGFLLGFGMSVLKDLLIDGKRGEDDRAAAYQYGRSVGLGMACSLVGFSVMIPTRLQEWAMEYRGA